MTTAADLPPGFWQSLTQASNTGYMSIPGVAQSDPTTADPSKGTDVLMPDGTYKHFAPQYDSNGNPVSPKIFISDSIPGGWGAALPGTPEYTHYSSVMTRDGYQGVIQIGAIVGGAALAGYLSSASAAGASTSEASSSLQAATGLGPNGLPTGAIGGGAGAGTTGTAVGAASGATADTLLPGAGVLAPTTGVPATLGQSALTGAGLPADLGGAGSIATATAPAAALAPGAGVLAGAGTPAAAVGGAGSALNAASGGGSGVPDAATGEASNTPLYGANPPPNATPGTGVPSVGGGSGGSNVPDLSGAGSSGFQLSDLLKYIPDIVAGVGSALGYQSQSDAAKEATAAQLKAAEDQIAFAKDTRDKAIALQQPFHDAAVTAVGQLQGMTGAPGTTGPTPDALMAADPGYQFRLSEGQKAASYGAAAGGYATQPGESGGFSKALTRYNQDYASGEYNNIYNRIASIAGMNQVSGPVQQSAYSSSIAPTTGAISDAGNASASGYAAQSNALQGLLTNFSNIIGGINWAKIGSGTGP